MVLTLVGGASLCGVAAFVLLIISTATDYWMQYRYSGNAANQGLWRFCINRKCHAHTLTVAFWDATRAFMLLSVLGCFAGVLLGVTASKRPWSRRVRTGGIALLLSGQKHTDFPNTFHPIHLLIIISYFIFLCAYQRSVSEPAPVSVSDS
uniref:Lens intrinsic membrane protein 2.2 n=1 Tax=Cyprinus carpio TaxID=7962 RepID=A0A8C1T7C4_CYPCA